MNEKIPCIKCDKRLFEYLWSYLEKWGYININVTVSWDDYPLLVINYGEILGHVANIFLIHADRLDRELVDDPEKFLARAAKLKGFEYKPNN